MTDYSAILESETDPGAASKSSLWKRWAKNWIAGFEGAVGAPRLLGQAVARAGNGLPALAVSASDAVAVTRGLLSVSGTLSTTSSTDIVAHTYTMHGYSGTVRCRASHWCGSGFSHVLSLYKNNVLVQAFTSSANQVTEARVVDVSIAVGDVLQWRHRTAGNTSTVSAVSMTASDTYVAQEILIPQSAI